ncbi:hypothetical protein WJX84_004221 [Apatococcus fuscideae]|uniref:AB hydrolase-1 domain-containing protein n=1 Tax=Apatococcus fuscideae TaxID=2026836 RepID=A0AAW1TDL9_9CHLO
MLLRHSSSFCCRSDKRSVPLLAAPLKFGNLRQEQHICRAVATNPAKSRHQLASGTGLEVIGLESAQGSRYPPLIFLHGSYHAAWCWQDKFLPYFHAAGFGVFAVSLRGQEVIASLDQAPILISHSLGGLIAQRYMVRLGEGEEHRPALRGLALLCSMPPSGNTGTAGRIMKNTPLLGVRLTWGFITKSFLRSKSACREMFFSNDLPEADIDRYQQLFRAEAGKVPVVDVKALNSNLPLPRPCSLHCPVLVLGCSNDRIVDRQGVEETAAHFGAQAVMLPDLAHDLMLDTRWQQAADALLQWMQAEMLLEN